MSLQRLQHDDRCSLSWGLALFFKLSRVNKSCYKYSNSIISGPHAPPYSVHVQASNSWCRESKIHPTRKNILRACLNNVDVFSSHWVTDFNHGLTVCFMIYRTSSKLHTKPAEKIIKKVLKAALQYCWWRMTHETGFATAFRKPIFILNQFIILSKYVRELF